MQETESTRLLGSVIPALSPELVARRFLEQAVPALKALRGALWLAPAGEDGRPVEHADLVRIGRHPEESLAAEAIPVNHPLVAALRQRPASVHEAGEPVVSGLFGAGSDGRAGIVAFQVEPRGILAFLVPERRAFSVQRVYALQPVADRLGYALAQALRHRATEEQVKALKKELSETRYTAGRLRALVENSLDLLFVLGYDGSIQLVSPSAAEATGMTLDELQGTSVFSMVHPDDVGGFIQEFRQRLLQRGLGPPRELRIRGIGGWRWVTARINNRLDDSKVGGVILSCHDITDLKRHAEELERARREAEAASQARGAFLAAMSHEIRTPMNSVIGLASLLEETDLDDRQRDMLRTIRSSGATLVGILNQILDLARIEAGEIVLRPQPVELTELVDEVLELVGPLAAEKGIELIDDVPPSMPANLLLDRQRVQQILLNLVTNAIKHTEAGSVTVGATLIGSGDPMRLELTVRDTGSGIPESQIGRIFEPFVQTAEGTQAGGTGLGLTITRQLVEAMGGTITVTSAVGAGSTFRVVLPVRTGQEAAPTAEPFLEGRRVRIVGATPEAAAAYGGWLRSAGGTVEAAPLETPLPDGAAAPDLIVVDAGRGTDRALAAVKAVREAAGESIPAVLLLPLAATLPSPRPERVAVVSKPPRRCRLLEAARRLLGEEPEAVEGAVSEEEESGRRLRILLAEDNPVNRKVALMMLERLDHEVETAASGPETVEAARAGRFDVILLDLEMPGFGGLEAARQIRSLTLERPPYIVAMTGHVLPADRERCFAAGMDAFLPKPVVLEDLRRVLARVPAGPEAGQAPGGKEPVIDTGRLSAISSVTPGLLQQLVELFLADAPERIDAIAGAVEAGNLHEAAQSAHQLKGAAANMGARAIEALALRVETLARTGRREGLAALVEPLREAYEATREELLAALEREDDGFVQG